MFYCFLDNDINSTDTKWSSKTKPSLPFVNAQEGSSKGHN